MSRDTKNKYQAICPHCDHVNRDSWDLDIGQNEWETVGCPRCGEEYEVIREVMVEYSTRKLTPEKRPDAKKKTLLEFKP